MNEFLQTLLYAVITTCLPILMAYGISYLKAKRDIKLQSIESTYVKETITDATNIVIKAVQTVGQNYVDDLKKAGTFKLEDQEIARNKAIAQAKDLMSLDTTNLIVEKYNDLDQWITNTLESYIASTKKNK